MPVQIKHHYIPVFYLKRWTTNGLLVEFSKPYGLVKPIRRSPAGTGWVEKLYEMHGYPDELAQQIEDRFFKPVDSLAAQTLLEMETQGNRVRWNPSTRSAWSRFLVSLST